MYVPIKLFDSSVLDKNLRMVRIQRRFKRLPPLFPNGLSR
jgi:hypothetical protein